MPLIYATVGEVNIVKRIDGAQDVRSRLEELGITPGTAVTLVSSLSGDIIVNVGEARFAISRELAERILI